MMKQWPADKSVMPLANDLIDPLRDALRKLYRMRRTDVAGVDYDGYEFEQPLTATLHQPDVMLSGAGLVGQDAALQILLIAFQLGYLQGRRSREREVEQLEVLARLSGKGSDV